MTLQPSQVLLVLALAWPQCRYFVSSASPYPSVAFVTRPSSCDPSSTFQLQHRPSYSTTSPALQALPPSKVVEEEASPEDPPQPPIETIDPESIEELKYNRSDHPVPGQPWRRGETDGAEDPIEADWRREAEQIIQRAVEKVGGEYVGTTWFPAKCVVTIDPDLSNVLFDPEGPEVILNEPSSDPNLDPRKNFGWQRNNPEIARRKLEEERGYPFTQDVPPDSLSNQIDVDALSTVAKSVLGSLSEESVEDRLQVTARHEIILTTPGRQSDVLQLQKEFDAFKGFDVIVQTMDPWKSNRVLRGKLIERNALDLKINVKGRVVTIPLNFVDEVRLPKAKTEKGDRNDFK